MASAEQIKALLKSSIKDDDERLLSVAMQVAAHKATLGHGRLAVQLHALVDETRNGPLARPVASGPADSLTRTRGALPSLLETSYPTARLPKMILGHSWRRRSNGSSPSNAMQSGLSSKAFPQSASSSWSVPPARDRR